MHHFIKLKKRIHYPYTVDSQHKCDNMSQHAEPVSDFLRVFNIHLKKYNAVFTGFINDIDSVISALNVYKSNMKQGIQYVNNEYKTVQNNMKLKMCQKRMLKEGVEKKIVNTDQDINELFEENMLNGDKILAIVSKLFTIPDVNDYVVELDKENTETTHDKSDTPDKSDEPMLMSDLMADKGKRWSDIVAAEEEAEEKNDIKHDNAQYKLNNTVNNALNSCDELTKKINTFNVRLDDKLHYTREDDRVFHYHRIKNVTPQHIDMTTTNDIRGRTVFDHVNSRSADLLKSIFEEAKKHAKDIKVLVETYGYYELEYNKFEDPEKNTVYYENKTSSDVYRSYLSMCFSFCCNHYSKIVHHEIMEECASYGLYPNFFARKKNDVSGSTTCLIRFERKY